MDRPALVLNAGGARDGTLKITKNGDAFEIWPVKPDEDPAPSPLAIDADPKLLARWAFNFGALSVHHDYDLREHETLKVKISGKIIV